MPLLRYALRRIGQTVPVALLVTVLIFLLIKLLPGDPATAILGERGQVVVDRHGIRQIDLLVRVTRG